jgi:hypothetical protein
MPLPISVKNVPFYDDGLTQLLIYRGPDSIQGLSSLSSTTVRLLMGVFPIHVDFVARNTKLSFTSGHLSISEEKKHERN